MKLILASNSPRRKELLSKLNYTFDVIPADCEERTNAASPADMVKELAVRKALNVYRQHNDSCVIGCDTVVDLDGKVLGKPHSYDEAAAMLAALSGKTHKVHTGVCVMSATAVYVFVDSSLVTFDKLSDQRILNYVDTGSPMDKAGGYGIQDSGFVKDITGSYDNVMGLPTERLANIIQGILAKYHTEQA